MEDLYQKYSDLFKENEDNKLRIAYLEKKLSEVQEREKFKFQNEENNSNFSCKICKCDENAENNSEKKENNLRDEIEKHKKLTHEAIQTQKMMSKVMSSLLGYQFTKIDETRFTLQSMYSFNEEDYFIFSLKENQFDLVRNATIESYSKEMNIFIIKGQSVSAFLAHVTLDLFNQKTFQ